MKATLGKLLPSIAGVIAVLQCGAPAQVDETEIERGSKRATELLRKHDDAGAEKIYAELSRRYPANANLLRWMASCQYRQQKYKAAHEALIRALALAPNDTDTLDSLGMVYHALRRYDECVAAYRRAVELKPDDRHLKHYLKRAEEDRDRASILPKFNKPRSQTESA